MFHIVDAYSRTIVAWRAATHIKTVIELDAIEMARWPREKDLSGLLCHSDSGSQLLSIRCGERLADFGAVPCIGTSRESSDNASSETVNGYQKFEFVPGPDHLGPRKIIEELELATLGWGYWHNAGRYSWFYWKHAPPEFEQTSWQKTQLCGRHKTHDRSFGSALGFPNSSKIFSRPGFSGAVACSPDENYSP